MVITFLICYLPLLSTPIPAFFTCIVFFLSEDGVDSECYFFLLSLHLTTLFFQFITHSHLPPYNSIDFLAGEGVKASVSSFFFNPITPAFFIHHSTSSSSFFLAGFFNEKFRLIDWRWSVWRAAYTIRLKFCFLTITQTFLNGID